MYARARVPVSVRVRTCARALNPKLNPPPQRKLYTIHLADKQKPLVFHIQEEADAPTSSYLVCFENVVMGKQMVELIRTHYALKGDWPNTEISPETPLDLVLPQDAPPLTDAVLEKLPRIWMCSWTEPELDFYAKVKFLNLFEIRADQTVRMFRFEYELETLQTRLEKNLGI